MKVARYYSNKDVRLEDMPVPQPGPGEILVNVRASGICGTDVMEWYRTQKGPRVLGHEIAGEIVASKTDKYKVGQRVFVSHHVPCERCKYCLAGNHTACATLHAGNYDPGGYSEFIRVPETNVNNGVYVIPENVGYAEASMIEPLACAIRGLRVIGVKPSDTVLVIGCGVSGLMNIKIARHIGARVLAVDIDDFHMQKAKDCGADEVYHAKDLTGVKAEHVLLCTGAYPAVKDAFKCVDKKGTILLFAIPDKDITLPTLDVWRNEITVTSSYGAAPVDLAESLDVIQRGQVTVKDLITHLLPFDKIQEGFDLVSSAKESLKVVLTPGQES